MRRFTIPLFFLILIGAPAGGVTWPTGAAPCNDINDLQACFDGVVSGDIIEVEANAIPSQGGVSMSPAKSFTLRPAAGFLPVFADFTSIFAAGSDADITVVIEGLTFVRGGLAASQGGEGIFDVTFRDNVIQQAFNDVSGRSASKTFSVRRAMTSISSLATEPTSTPLAPRAS